MRNALNQLSKKKGFIWKKGFILEGKRSKSEKKDLGRKKGFLLRKKGILHT